MDKINKVFLHPFAEDMGPNPAYGETVSDPDLNINQRVAQLLMLLQQLDESAGGLETLPTPELGEIVSSALGLCGFEDPIRGAGRVCDSFGGDRKTRSNSGGSSVRFGSGSSQLNQACPATQLNSFSRWHRARLVSGCFGVGSQGRTQGSRTQPAATARGSRVLCGVAARKSDPWSVCRVPAEIIRIDKSARS